MSERALTLREEEAELIKACRDGHGTFYGQEDLADVVAALASECENREQNERAEMRCSDEYHEAYRRAEAERDALAADLVAAQQTIETAIRRLADCGSHLNALGRPDLAPFGEQIICPRCDGQTYDVGSCGLCRNIGWLDENGDALAAVDSADTR